MDTSAGALAGPGVHDVGEICGCDTAGGRSACLKLVHDETIRSPQRPGWSVYCSEESDGSAGDERPRPRVELVVSVVIPTFNEALNLPSVLLQIPKEGTEVVVVDGHSSDGTVDVVHELLPDAVVIKQPGKGKGDALRAGFQATTGDIVVMIDADGSMSPREIPAFVGALLRGADLAKGSRKLPGGGSADLTFVRSMGNWGLGWVFNRIHATRHTDLCYGYMAFWRSHLSEIMPDCDGFEVETLLNVRAAQAGLRVVEVPSYEGRRGYGESNLHPVRDGLRVLHTLGTELPTSARMRARRTGSPVPAVELPTTQVATPEATTETTLTTSVIVCAYTLDRWGMLTAAIKGALDQDPAPAEVVLVIDHNRELEARAALELDDERVRIVANSHARGLSGARNSGIDVARGDVVAFLDDDAVPAGGWLASLVGPFTDPAVMATGGTARPVWSDGRPGWFPLEFDWVVGCSYRGQPEGRAEIRNPLGCNMALRRSVFAAVEGFREGVGRVGTRPLGCEETELCIRLRQSLPGSRILLVPEAVVDHHVTPERHRFAYFRQRCFAEGISKATVTGEVGTGDGLASERAYVTRTLPRGVLNGVGRTVLLRDANGLRHSAAIVAGFGITTLGYLRGRLARS